MAAEADSLAKPLRAGFAHARRTCMQFKTVALFLESRWVGYVRQNGFCSAELMGGQYP